MAVDKSTQVMVRLDPEMKRRLEAEAAASERNVSQMIRFAIRQLLDSGGNATAA